jgi:hypothetical protein
MNDLANLVNVTTLQPKRADAEIAADIRARLLPALGPALAIMNEGKQAGLIVTFNLMFDQFGHWTIGNLSINKPL